MPTFLHGWVAALRRRPIAGKDGVARFLSSEAAFLAQNAATSYCRARAGMQAEQLFREEMFLAALDRCRWEAYAAVLADMIVLLEARLRPDEVQSLPALIEPLTTLYAGILNADPLPSHRAEGWGEVVAALQPRLAVAQMAAPRPPDQIAKSAGRRLYEVLPFDSAIARDDRPVVVNSIRFGMVRFSDRLRQRLDPAALRDDLLGRGDRPEPCGHLAGHEP